MKNRGGKPSNFKKQREVLDEFKHDTFRQRL